MFAPPQRSSFVGIAVAGNRIQEAWLGLRLYYAQISEFPAQFPSEFRSLLFKSEFTRFYERITTYLSKVDLALRQSWIKK